MSRLRRWAAAVRPRPNNRKHNESKRIHRIARSNLQKLAVELVVYQRGQTNNYFWRVGSRHRWQKKRIFSEEWKDNQRGTRAGFNQSREHIRLIEEERYQLMTFPMHRKDDKEGRAKIGGFTEKLTKRKLSKVGGDWFASDYDDASSVVLAEEISSPEKYSEGSRVVVTINAYERNPKARAACIAHHGYVCAVCGFNFANIYGDIGEKFIHIHHDVVPIGKIGKEYEIDPIQDLIPVCPNCHAMIHRAEPPLTVEQLRQHISDLKVS